MAEKLINKIILHKSYLDHKVAGMALEANSYFVFATVNRCFFKEEEIPRVALQLFRSYEWISEIRNGGIEQYASNCDWIYEHLELIDECFFNANATQHLKLFRSIRKKIDTSPYLLTEMKKNGGFDFLGDKTIYSWFDNKEKEFYELNRQNDIEKMLKSYITNLDIISIVPDDKWETSILELIKYNPYFQSRKKEQENKIKIRKERHKRKLKQCSILSKMIRKNINANRGEIQTIIYNMQEFEAVIHRTNCGDKIAYLEHNGYSIILSYPNGNELARIKIDY